MMADEQRKQYKYIVTLESPIVGDTYERVVTGVDSSVGSEWLVIIGQNGKFTSFATSRVVEYGREPVEQEQE